MCYCSKHLIYLWPTTLLTPIYIKFILNTFSLQTNLLVKSTKLWSHFKPGNKQKNQTKPTPPHRNAKNVAQTVRKTFVYESWNKKAACHFVQSQLGICTTAGISHSVTNIHKGLQKHTSIDCRVTNFGM